MKPIVRSLLILVGLVCPLLGAQAGVMIQQEQRVPGKEPAVAQTIFYIDAGKLRIETKTAEGKETLIIFDQAKQVVWVIDRSAGSYYELTSTQVQAMSARLNQAMQEMEARLAQMPPERRKMMEGMVKQMMGQRGGTPKVTVRELSRGERMGQFLCTRYELLTGGKLSGEIWAAPLEQLPLQEGEYETLQALGRFFEPLGQRAPAGAGWSGGRQQIDGFPVRSVTYTGQRTVAETQVLKLERRDLEANLFSLPAGLQKTEFAPEN